jgi:hypothetical protein
MFVLKERQRMAPRFSIAFLSARRDERPVVRIILKIRRRLITKELGHRDSDNCFETRQQAPNGGYRFVTFTLPLLLDDSHSVELPLVHDVEASLNPVEFKQFCQVHLPGEAPINQFVIAIQESIR